MIHSFSVTNGNVASPFKGMRSKVLNMLCRKEGLDPVEDSQYCHHYFIQLLTGYKVDQMFVYLDDNKEVVGYLLGSKGTIWDIYFPLVFRHRGFGTALLQKYIEETDGEVEKWQGRSYSDTPDIVGFFVKNGFGVATRHDLFAPGCKGIAFTKDGSIKFHEKRLDSADKSYVDFRGDYAVVDGHYTLDQLESLLVLARKELKGGD